MVITWDEPKRLANFEKHGLDFERFEEAFDFDSSLRIPAKSSRTGRSRFGLLGMMNGELVVVAVVSPLGSEALSLVSLRPHLRGRGASIMAAENHAPGYVPNPHYTQEDWDEVSDNPELTDEQLAQARPLADVMPELVEAVRRRRGPQKAPLKAQIALRVDRDVLDGFRATGPGWQARMNEALRDWLARRVA